MNETTNAIVEVARSTREETDTGGIVTLSTGVRVKVHAVAASLIDQVTAKIHDPDPPKWYNEDKGREEPNYSDPVYIRDLGEAERARGIAAMDALIMFGFELVDGVPEDDIWVKKLDMLGVEIDSGNDLEVEFAYKKYIASSTGDITLVTAKSGISAEDVEAAEKSFRG
jgi:hypothetical protein